MSPEFPDRWKSAPLRSLTSKIGSGATPRGGERAYKKSGTPLIRSMNVHCDGFRSEGLAYLDKKQAAALDGVTVQAGDVLLNITGASIGRVTQAPQAMDGARVNQHVCIIRPVKGIEPSFVARYLASPSMQAFIAGENYGVTRQALTKEMIENIRLPIPPLAEQRRIIAKLDSLFDRSKSAHQELARIPRLIERYKQAILAAAFRSDLTGWRMPATVPPLMWSERSLGEIADVGTGSTPKRGESRFYKNGTIPWITSAAVNKVRIDAADEMITEIALRETNCKVFPAGTLVMAMYGEGQTRGRVAVLGIPAATNQALAAISIRDSKAVLADYILWFLRANYLELRIKAAGGVQPNLNLGIIKAFRVPLPPITEQYQIVRRIDRVVSHCDRILEEVTSGIDLVERLDHAALAKAFRGELLPAGGAR